MHYVNYYGKWLKLIMECVLTMDYYQQNLCGIMHIVMYHTVNCISQENHEYQHEFEDYGKLDLEKDIGITDSIYSNYCNLISNICIL